MTEQVKVFTADEWQEFKTYIDLKPAMSVLAAPQNVASGKIVLHSARCPHIKNNKTAKLIAPGQIRVVARKRVDLQDYLTSHGRAEPELWTECTKCM